MRVFVSLLIGLLLTLPAVADEVSIFANATSAGASANAGSTSGSISFGSYELNGQTILVSGFATFTSGPATSSNTNVYDFGGEPCYEFTGTYGPGGSVMIMLGNDVFSGVLTGAYGGQTTGACPPNSSANGDFVLTSVPASWAPFALGSGTIYAFDLPLGREGGFLSLQLRTATPEPASLGLICAGLLVLSRRMVRSRP